MEEEQDWGVLVENSIVPARRKETPFDTSPLYLSILFSIPQKPNYCVVGFRPRKMNGTTQSGRGEEAGAGKAASGGYGRRVLGWELALRALALGLTLAAAVVLGVNKQTTTVAVQVSASLPPLYVATTAKWHYLSAFVYFVVGNAVASGYAALSLLLLFLISRGGRTAALAMIIVADVLMAGLLFSSCGAATAVGVIGKKGNSHVRWNKVCNVFGGFCDRVVVAIGLSLAGSFAFVLLAAFAVVGLHRRSS